MDHEAICWRDSLPLIAAAGLALVLFGCSLPKGIVPVQLGRMAQIEEFEIYLTPNLVPGEAKNNAERLTERFGPLLGRANWIALRERHGRDDLERQLIQRQFVIRGQLVLLLYPDPYRDSTFLLEGRGRFLLLDEEVGPPKEPAILLSGDSFIDSHRFSTEDLPGILEIPVSFLITHLADELQTYFHQSVVILKIAIERVQEDKEVYRIAYDQNHLLVVKDTEPPLEIGRVRFLGDYNDAKIVDLGNEGALRRDYNR